MVDQVDAEADIQALTAEIVSAYVSHNALSVTDLTKLIAEVHRALRALANTPAARPEAESLKPAVPIRRSVTPDYLICLDDGMQFRTLKRHLAQLGMTPAQYREKWNLSPDYPMVAPNYSATRSQLARSSGLGRKPAAPEPESAATMPPARRGKAAA